MHVRVVAVGIGEAATVHDLPSRVATPVPLIDSVSPEVKSCAAAVVTVKAVLVSPTWPVDAAVVGPMAVARLHVKVVVLGTEAMVHVLPS